MATAICPECGGDVDVGKKPFEGQKVMCPECGTQLEVISTRPLELDWVYEEPFPEEEEGENW